MRVGKPMLRTITMRLGLFFVATAGFFMALAACPPHPVTPAPDADAVAPPAPTPPPPSVTQAACDTLKSLGCAEGAASNCAVTLEHMAEDRLTGLDPQCVASAKSVTAVRACGVACR